MTTNQRAIDKAIAVTVLGYTVKDYGEDALYYIAPKGTCGSSCIKHEHLVPHYSEDMNELLQVVEEVKDRGLRLVLSNNKQGWEAAWSRRLSDKEADESFLTEEQLAYSYHEDPCVAVCLSLVEAVKKLPRRG